MERLDVEEKQQIAVLAAQGMSNKAIGRMMKRSAGAVAAALKKPDVALLKQNIEERLADKFEEITEKILDAVTKTDIEKASLRDKAISAGVFLDKSRLIRGQSTQNTAVLMATAVVDADKAESERWAAIRAEAQAVAATGETAI